MLQISDQGVQVCLSSWICCEFSLFSWVSSSFPYSKPPYSSFCHWDWAISVSNNLSCSTDSKFGSPIIDTVCSNSFSVLYMLKGFRKSYSTYDWSQCRSSVSYKSHSFTRCRKWSILIFRQYIQLVKLNHLLLMTVNTLPLFFYVIQNACSSSVKYKTSAQ